METDMDLLKAISEIVVPEAVHMLELGEALPNQDAWKTMSESVAVVVAKSSVAFRRQQEDKFNQFAKAELDAANAVTSSICSELNKKTSKIMLRLAEHLKKKKKGSLDNIPWDAITEWAPSSSKLGLSVFNNKHFAQMLDDEINGRKSVVLTLQISFPQLMGTSDLDMYDDNMLALVDILLAKQHMFDPDSFRPFREQARKALQIRLPVALGWKDCVIVRACGLSIAGSIASGSFFSTKHPFFAQSLADASGDLARVGDRVKELCTAGKAIANNFIAALVDESDPKEPAMLILSQEDDNDSLTHFPSVVLSMAPVCARILQHILVMYTPTSETLAVPSADYAETWVITHIPALRQQIEQCRSQLTTINLPEKVPQDKLREWPGVNAVIQYVDGAEQLANFLASLAIECVAGELVSTLQTLVTAVTAEKFSGLVPSIEQGDLEEKKDMFYSVVQSVETKTIVRVWKKYQALTAKFDGHVRDGQKTEATMEDMIQDLHINDVAKQKIVEVQRLRAQHLETIKTCMGIFTSFQALWRPLSPDETRQTLVARCRRGLTHRKMSIPPPLSLYLSKMQEMSA
jgi:hypothetical protein